MFVCFCAQSASRSLCVCVYRVWVDVWVGVRVFVCTVWVDVCVYRVLVDVRLFVCPEIGLMFVCAHCCGGGVGTE